MRLTLILCSVLALTACDRFNERNGARKAPGARGPVMEGVINPAGLKVPAAAVDTTPSSGYWNCGEGFNGYTVPEHEVRCTMHVDPKSKAYSGRRGYSSTHDDMTNNR